MTRSFLPCSIPEHCSRSYSHLILSTSLHLNFAFTLSLATKPSCIMSSQTSPTLPTSPTSSKIPLPQLKSVLQKVVQARGHVYCAKTALAFYWEDDNTSAKDDVNLLEKTFKDCWGIETTRLELRRDDAMPGFTVTNEFDKMVMDSHIGYGNRQSLVIFAYVGHASVDITRGLRLESKSGNHIWWRFLKERVFSQCLEFEKIDRFGFLDCCYAGVTTRCRTEQTIQILAACGPEETARSRNMPITFTQRFCGHVRYAQSHHQDTISIAALFQELQQKKSSSTPNPQLGIVGGINPIVIPIKKPPNSGPSPTSRLPIPSPRPDPNEQHVVVKLTLAGSEKEVTKEFREVIATLPAPFKVQIVDAFRTVHSALVFMRMTWGTWARFSTVLELEPIDVIIGPSLVHADASPR